MAGALYYIYYTLVLLFGLALSFAFAGLHFSKRSLALIGGLFVMSGLVQVCLIAFRGTDIVWKLYPFITHLPTVLTLCLFCRKRLSTSLASVAGAYLFCQPSRWFGLLLQAITRSVTAQYLTSIVCLIVIGAVTLLWLVRYISPVFDKANRIVCILAAIPVIYYLYDYATVVYGSPWMRNQPAVEFMTFFLCVVYMCFCVIYSKEYEQRADAERSERFIRFAIEQQAHEMEATLRSERETRILRHDMRMFLNNLSLCMEDDPQTARKMIASYADSVEAAAVKRYCSNTVINCVLSGFAAQCDDLQVDFRADVALDTLAADEIMFSSVLSNALDNALNAQKELPAEKRRIQLMIKTSSDRLLLSVKNPFAKTPILVDGMPVSTQTGHGYGTQSISFLTARMGGKCRFAVENDQFVLRVIL